MILLDKRSPQGHLRTVHSAGSEPLQETWSGSEHGVVTERVPWAEHDSRFTRDFEDLVAWLAREMNKTAVKTLMRIALATVGNIIDRVVARVLDLDRLRRLYVIGIDEVSYRKGHKYLTVVADHATGNPVWIGEGRSQATVGRDELGDESAKQL